MSQPISKEIFLNAFRLMATAKTMAEKYEANKEITSKYVHATSRGHEAIHAPVAAGCKAKWGL
jgi:2-oxoisovalerate dehydrogenase E1 component